MSPAQTGDDRTEVFVVLCTVPDAATGRALARRLVSSGEAACVNVLPGVRSIYRWEGEVQEGAEELLIVKTDADCVDAVIASIERHHPYDCPEALAIPVAAGSEPYLAWVRTGIERG